MKTLKYLVLTLVLAATATTVEAKHVKTSHMYMFGFAASFVDSTLYLTDVQDGLVVTRRLFGPVEGIYERENGKVQSCLSCDFRHNKEEG